MDGYSFNLSSSDFTKWAGVSLQAYNTAIQELIDQRYLVKKADGSKNNYIFYINFGYNCHIFDQNKKYNNHSIGYFYKFDYDRRYII